MTEILELIRNLLVFIVILGSAIFIHEFGHFLASRLFRVEIEEFGFGLPPKMLELGVWRGTRFTLNWIPLGGFVRPKGEYDPESTDGFAASSPIARISIFLAGALANLILGFAILTTAFMAGGPEEQRVRVLEVYPTTPADQAGLMAEDIIVEVNGAQVEGAIQLRQLIRSNLGVPMEFVVDRRGAEVQIQLTPRVKFPEDEGPAGFASRGVIARHNVIDAAENSLAQIGLIVQETGRAIYSAVAGDLDQGEVRLVGLGGLKQASDWALEGSIRWGASYPILYLAALINVGLGLTNLLPIPALDGGRVVLVLLEMLRGRRLNAQLEKWIHVAGALTLIALMVLLTVRDILFPLF